LTFRLDEFRMLAQLLSIFWWGFQYVEKRGQSETAHRH